MASKERLSSSWASRKPCRIANKDLVNPVKHLLSQSLQFYFRHSPLELRYAKASFSQFGEDLALSTFLNQETGFYVDVGAYHPFNFSNSYLFYKQGWSGLNIEPNPYGFRLLRKYRKRDTTLQLGISHNEGNVRFLDQRTFSRILQEGEQPESGRIIEIATKPLHEVLAKEISPSKEIDFLSTDCEGHDLIVLKSNDWETYRPRFVITEDGQPFDNSAIVSFMKGVAYLPLCRLGMSRIFVEESAGKLLE